MAVLAHVVVSLLAAVVHMVVVAVEEVSHPQIPSSYHPINVCRNLLKLENWNINEIDCFGATCNVAPKQSISLYMYTYSIIKNILT